MTTKPTMFAELIAIYEDKAGFIVEGEMGFSALLKGLRIYFPTEHALGSQSTLGDLRKWADKMYKEIS